MRKDLGASLFHKGAPDSPISGQRGASMLPAKSLIAQDEEIQCLREQGFSEEQIALILRYRDDYTTGFYKDEPPEQRRLEFMRWLYTNGKIEA